jgi:hypothetical protein
VLLAMIFEERNIKIAVEPTIIKEDFKTFVVTIVVERITMSTKINVSTFFACASLKIVLIVDSR